MPDASVTAELAASPRLSTRSAAAGLFMVNVTVAPTIGTLMEFLRLAVMVEVPDVRMDVGAAAAVMVSVSTIAVTVTLAVPLTPSDEAVTVTDPAVAPVRVTVTTPLEFVVAVVVAAPEKLADVLFKEKFTVALGTAVPPPSLTVAVMDELEPTGMEVGLATTVTVPPVPPVIVTDVFPDTLPIDAVMTATVVVAPAVKTTIARPLVSVTAVALVSWPFRPLSRLKVTVAPVTGCPILFTT